MISPLVTLSLLAAISARLRSSAGTFTDIGIILDIADPKNKGKSWKGGAGYFSANL